MGKGMKAKMLKEWRTEFEKWCLWICIEWPEEGSDSEEEEDEEDEEEDEESDEE